MHTEKTEADLRRAQAVAVRGILSDVTPKSSVRSRLYDAICLAVMNGIFIPAPTQYGLLQFTYKEECVTPDYAKESRWPSDTYTAIVQITLFAGGAILVRRDTCPWVAPQDMHLSVKRVIEIVNDPETFLKR